MEALQSRTMEEVNINTKTELSTEKVFGMWWRMTPDYFPSRIASNFKNAEVLYGGRVPTKRDVLRLLMKIFVPLELLANFLMHVKILLQKVLRTESAGTIRFWRINIRTGCTGLDFYNS